MKKYLFVIVAIGFLFFSFISSSVAADAPEEMVNALDNAKSEALYDYKKGSMTLSDFVEVSVNDPELETNTVQVAFAEYESVRDYIFTMKHREVVYYDPENGQVLQEAQVSAIDDIASYKESYENATGSKVQMGMIILLGLILPLVVMGLVMYVWEPRQYSTTTFKIANRLFDNVQETYK